MRKRRLRRHPAALEVSAFINLIIVLVPFLLSTAVFTRLAVMDLTLPAQSSGAEKLSGELQLEVVIRADALEVGDRIGGLIERIPAVAGGHDVQSLAVLMGQLKQRFPQQRAATVLAEPNTSYDALVQVMDRVRSGRQLQGRTAVTVDYFPEISVGDAPVRTRQASL
jgi:biopolymer transport protein ExbD